MVFHDSLRSNAFVQKSYIHKNHAFAKQNNGFS